MGRVVVRTRLGDGLMTAGALVLLIDTEIGGNLGFVVVDVVDDRLKLLLDGLLLTVCTCFLCELLTCQS